MIGAVAISLAACSAGGPASADPGLVSAPPGASGTSIVAPTPSGSRPASPAVIAITSPAQGALVEGATAHIVVSLKGAEIVAATSTNVRPDRGHVHLYVDNVLVSMNYGLEQDLPVRPGTYVLKAEFVAADHAPFNPRVWSDEVLFTVK
jgi:hypothetical protein